jgi:hypothetical protein
MLPFSPVPNPPGIILQFQRAFFDRSSRQFGRFILFDAFNVKFQERRFDAAVMVTMNINAKILIDRIRRTVTGGNRFDHC